MLPDSSQADIPVLSEANTGAGTSGNPCDIDFRGYAPFSERETIAVKNWIDSQKSKIVLYINFHAYGQLWMTPYGYSTDTPSNEEEMVSVV